MSSCAGMSWRLRGGAAFVSAFLVITAFGRPACAETLEQALTDAYLINPVLNAARARLRATDEQVALAKAGLRPFISGEADWNFVNQNIDVAGGGRSSSSASVNPLNLGATGIGSEGVTHPHGYSVQLTQPLFEGFQNLNAIRAAKSTVQAARDSLRSVEQTVLLDAATAYVNVVRDAAIVRLRENDVTVLTEQLKEDGRLATVIGRTANNPSQGQAYLFVKVAGEASGAPHFDAGARPLPDFAPKPAFTF